MRVCICGNANGRCFALLVCAAAALLLIGRRPYAGGGPALRGKGFPPLPAPAAGPGCGRPEAQGRCVPRCTRRQWHCPRDCRIMSVTLFHSQTSYCAEAGRAAFCGTPAAHLPNGNRFGGGVAVRQQGGGTKAGAVCARQQAKSGRPPSRPVRGGGLRAYRPRFLFCAAFRHRRSQNHTFCKQPATMAAGDRAGSTAYTRNVRNPCTASRRKTG